MICPFGTCNASDQQNRRDASKLFVLGRSDTNVPLEHESFKLRQVTTVDVSGILMMPTDSVIFASIRVAQSKILAARSPRMLSHRHHQLDVTQSGDALFLNANIRCKAEQMLCRTENMLINS